MSGAPLRIGFIGAGVASQQFHIPHFIGDERCRVMALAEQRTQLGRAVAARWQIPEVVADHRDLLTRPDIDAVVVVTPRAATAPMVLEALEAGKHVLSEKPMAHTVEQGRRLANAARERGLIYAVGFMKRYDAGVDVTRKQLSALRISGELGQLLLARFWNFAKTYAISPGPFVRYSEKRPERFATWPVAPDWLPADAMAGYDWFMNSAIHNVNLMRFLLGELQVMSAHRMGDDAMVASLRGNDTLVSFELAKSAPGEWREGAEFLFERGRMVLELPSPMAQNISARVRVEHNNGMPGAFEPTHPQQWSFANQARAFVGDVLAGTVPASSGEDSVNDLILTEAIWQLVVRGGQ